MELESRRELFGVVPVSSWKEVKPKAAVVSDLNLIQRVGGMLVLKHLLSKQVLAFSQEDLEHLNNRIKKGVLPVQFRLVAPSTRPGRPQSQSQPPQEQTLG